MRIWIAATISACILSLVLIGSVHAETHVVKVRDLVFDDDELHIQTGDTVRWEWEGGTHTVTSGTGPSAPDVGDLFDVDSDFGDQVFEYVFDDAGTFPYFCRFHFASGMTGTIEVTEGTPVDAYTWGKIKKIFDTTAPRQLDR